MGLCKCLIAESLDGKFVTHNRLLVYRGGYVMTVLELCSLIRNPKHQEAILYAADSVDDGIVLRAAHTTLWLATLRIAKF